MDRPLSGSNIYLIGMMGSGKTTVGKLLAEKLNYSFFDTDDYVEKFAQKSISEIFAIETETKFRELESKVLVQLSRNTESVISTGGGIVQKRENWICLHQGLIVWLDADLNLINQRLAGDQSRPLASKLESLFITRRPIYSHADIHIVIDPEQKPEEIVNSILTKALGYKPRPKRTALYAGTVLILNISD